MTNEIINQAITLGFDFSQFSDDYTMQEITTVLLLSLSIASLLSLNLYFDKIIMVF